VIQNVFSSSDPSSDLSNAGVGTTGFVISLSWLTSVTSGHTKRVTTNAIMLSAYCVGNSAGPFMWQTKYKPRQVFTTLICDSSRSDMARPGITFLGL
jgi:hypothetical protein